MADIVNLLAAAAGAGGEAAETDPNFNQTVLLLHGDGSDGVQNNTFLDSSSNNFTITRNGNVTQGSFSPFGRTSGNLDDAYNPAVNGGSGYFDGTGDYLSLAGNAAFSIATSTTPFTIESWIYITAAGGAIFSEQYTGSGDTVAIAVTLCDGSSVDTTTGQSIGFGYFSGSWVSAAISTTTVPLNQWTHVACVFTGSTTKIFIDGVDRTKASSPTPATTWGVTGDNGDAWYVGRRWNALATEVLSGYISNFRFVNGSAVYTSGFTPPTAPLTAITDTELLLNFTNAGIFDNTGKNNLETVGNAQIDTTTKKYGTGSMEFDGTGDWLQVPYSQEFDFGTGDFTIEFFLYLNNISSRMDILEKRTTGGTASGLQILANRSVNGRLELFSSPAGWPSIAVNSVLSATTWHHVAITRNGSTFTMWVDGVSVGTDTDASATADQVAPLYIGNSKDNQPTNGFIDEFRITKGVARYTTTFTPPDKAFPDQ